MIFRFLEEINIGNISLLLPPLCDGFLTEYNTRLTGYSTLICMTLIFGEGGGENVAAKLFKK